MRGRLILVLGVGWGGQWGACPSWLVTANKNKNLFAIYLQLTFVLCPSLLLTPLSFSVINIDSNGSKGKEGEGEEIGVGWTGRWQAFRVVACLFVFVLNALNWTGLALAKYPLVFPPPFFALYTIFFLSIFGVAVREGEGENLSWLKYIVTRSFIEGLFNECLCFDSIVEQRKLRMCRKLSVCKCVCGLMLSAASALLCQGVRN